MNNCTPRTGRRPQPGFTLLEMLVACVLMTVLMTTSIGVLRSVLSDLKRESAQQTLISNSLAEQLRVDLINARQYRLGRDGLELLGYVAREPADGAPLLTLAIVGYRIYPTSLGKLLIREQQMLGESIRPGFDPVSQQPLWMGATEIRLASSYVGFQDSTIDPREALLLGNPADWLPLPPMVELTVLGEQGNALFHETILRGEEH